METPSATSGSKLQSVLMATDLSVSAQLVQDWAVAIAASQRSHLDLVHAVHLAGWATDFLEIDARIPNEIESACREKLSDLGRSTRTANLEVTWHQVSGEPSTAILEFAAARGSGLIVVGTRGQKTLDTLLLGSTARRVMQHADCPVLSVQPQSSPPSGPIRRILVATDFSREAAAALHFASMLLHSRAESPDRSEILLLHAYIVPYDLLSTDGFTSAAAGLEQWHTAQTDVENRLESLAHEHRIVGIELLTRGVEGYPPDVIVEQARTHHVDLIAMGTHGRTGLSHAVLGSIAEKVIHGAPCPVLTVRTDRARKKKGDFDAG
jgi:nucleotide-binding universal stress UspA family protein